MNKYFKEIFYLVGEDKRKLPFMFILFLIQTLLEVLGIGLIAPYIALVVDFENSSENFYTLTNFFNLPNSKIDLLIFIGAILVSTIILKVFVAYFVNKQIINFVQRKRLDLVKRLMNNYQSLPYTEYTSRNSSEYIHRIQSLTYQFSEQVLAPLMRLVSDGVIALSILIFLAFYNIYALILLIFLLSLITGSYDFITKSRVKEGGIQANYHSTKMLQYVNEGISGLKEIRILGKEHYFFKKVKNSAWEFAEAVKNVQVLSVLPKFLLEMVLIFFIVTIVLVSSLSNQGSEVLVATLGVFGIAAIRILPIANLTAASIVSIRYARNGVSLLYSDCQKADSKVEDVIDTQESLIFKHLSISNISYQHDGSKQKSLTDVSLGIKFGEAIGIIGQSGSGKTTLVDLILGLLKPDSGHIEIDGMSIEENSILESWRRQIAYLPQKVFLIDASLRNNIALGVDNDDIDDDLIKISVIKASLVKMVEALPQGINTFVGESGIRISGGQAQRIALARAFYHGRNIIVMDESTSALDNKTEKEIINEITKLKGRITLIAIAHRLTTLEHCDRIYQLEDGKVKKVGSYNEVVRDIE
jgi:ABC-type bacteriocin/lantibiotic exporter with double-glycine peptidase domain